MHLNNDCIDVQLGLSMASMSPGMDLSHEPERFEYLPCPWDRKAVLDSSCTTEKNQVVSSSRRRSCYLELRLEDKNLHSLLTDAVFR